MIMRLVPLASLLWTSTLASALALGDQPPARQEIKRGEQSREAAKEIPVEPKLKAELRAVFSKHCEEAMKGGEEARARVLEALEPLDRERLQAAREELRRHTAQTEACKEAMAADLEKVRAGEEVKEQEWTKWIDDIRKSVNEELEKKKGSAK